jgi:hypothetical protein
MRSAAFVSVRKSYVNFCKNVGKQKEITRVAIARDEHSPFVYAGTLIFVCSYRRTCSAVLFSSVRLRARK